ncbi:threonine--tRNA ligase [Candidatus Woesebacteria bacterium RBG_19FT_COMBO_47_8]|uniref:Threonine--tRNA ligase n=1 Tax=Candidatus Woesebacteria bacterium RBG_13_46_13 TaxID=1802479 RepID=A0A1F7X3S7_9BACT|nr:MAG: threonine--tRNA ligase [Candidatus Woesebacteria bacterium RBG_13_46_13]OGM17610.1 MAG: threonine--tRNA ligase [Candidatus Woesebacteria bacterium RBG_19FT_COMBO_47_8]HJX59583.1 threonine--tRNA ligase [Patescibacteria group bacterium]
MKNVLDNLRHSTAHLLAAAVVKLWPDAKPTIGPVIENGFYYDFDMGKVKISEKDLGKIEEAMSQILPGWDKFAKKEVTATQAKKLFKENSYKIELIEELEKSGEGITLYKSGAFVDLCRGGHVTKASEIKYFKLLSLAGAYWRGSEKNKMLTRIYGTAFTSKAELDKYLDSIEEASENDHRKIGKDLGLFVFSDLVGKGLPLLTAKGSTIRRELERFIVDEEIKRGYQHVYTPPLAKTDLYKKSGHYPYYKDTMYPVMKVDDEELILRPMTCPHHFMLYSSEVHSYRELPIRIAEIAPQYRYEKSGELTGLIRIRMFNLADAHIFTAPEAAEGEIEGVLDLISYANSVMGLKKGEDYRYRLSLGDRGDAKKYYKDDKAWDKAEGILRKVLKAQDVPFYEAAGEAAFYGPKIDVQVRKLSGKEETAFTVQYDFVMPKRFDLKYIDKDGKEKEIVVIHRASIGCLERTIAFLIEKYHGSFPLWLSPVQVKVLPITEKALKYANSVYLKLKEAGIRTEVDSRNETLAAKIRDAQLAKVPYMLILGPKEEEASLVSVRNRLGKTSGAVGLPKFMADIKEEIAKKIIS